MIIDNIQVMLHDPLYDWSVGPSKVAARQAGEWEQLKQQEAGQGNRYWRNNMFTLSHIDIN